jgi:hypothetical protein
MARILRFRPDNPRGPGDVDAARVWEYVLPRLGFPLQDFVTREIDAVIAGIWNSSDPAIDYDECVEGLAALEEKDILLPRVRREKIVSLVFDYLERHGFLAGADGPPGDNPGD